MIQINNLSISNDKTKIYVDVESNEGETIIFKISCNFYKIILTIFQIKK